MQLAFSTNAYTRFDLARALQGIRDAGFTSAEILADVPHAYPGTLNNALICQIAKDVERTGLKVSNINANCSFGYFRDPPPEAFFEPSLISPNPVYREDRMRMIGRCLELAKAVGAANISITSGRLLGGVPPARAEQLLSEGLQRVLDLADRAGIDVGIECEPGLYLEYAAELRQWIDRLGHPRLGANLDVGHSHVLGESIPDAIRLLQGRIWNLHVEDIPGRKHYHMIPGEGTMDWPSLRDALCSIDYQRTVTVELYTHTADPDTAARKSHGFLNRLFG